jgi:geranylgeranyl diphosphate synthase, type I
MAAGDTAKVQRVTGFLAARRQEIARAAELFLARKGSELARVSPLGPDACARLAEFATGGKMIRGGLVCYASSFRSCDARASVTVAAAMELFQSALLIHDDIMDRDTHRRGRPSVYHQYEERARADGRREPAHLGTSLGICAGDIAFFIAFEILAEADVSAEVRARLVSLFARELSLVGVAQMVDMDAAATERAQTTEEILRLYLYKTGRYTFSLPLLAGACLCGLDTERSGELERTGEDLGMLFQIKDDELGLFGDAADTGKPVGSDIREGKKTIFHAALLRRAPSELGERVRMLWGSPDITEPEVRLILDALEGSGARSEVAELAASLAARVAAAASRPELAFLADLLAYSMDRRK